MDDPKSISNRNWDLIGYFKGQRREHEIGKQGMGVGWIWGRVRCLIKIQFMYVYIKFSKY